MMRSAQRFLTVAAFLCLLLPAGAFAMFQAEASDSLVQVMENANDSMKAEILISLCDELKNNYPEIAFEYGQQAIELSKELNSPLQIGRAYMAVARIYILRALYDKALDYLFLSLDQFETAESKQEIALCCDNIGLAYMSAGEYRNASRYYQRAWDLNREIRHYGQMVNNLINMGSNLVRQDSIEKGLNYYAVSLPIADSLNMKEEKLILLNQIGQGYDRLGRHEDALQQYYQTLELLEGQTNNYFYASTLTHIATSYYSLKNYQAAEKYALEALDLSRANRFNQLTARTSKILSDIYAQQYNFKLSYDYLVEYKMISDTILRAENAEKLQSYEARYNLDKKEQEIELLSAENERNKKSLQTRTIIISVIVSLLAILITMLYILVKLNRKYRLLNDKLSEQGKELEDLNEQKDKFFSFVAHNLKNPFNTIMGFAELMKRSTENKDREKVRQYANLIYNLSSQVQKVLSNLLEWSRLQRRSFEFKPETIELNSMIKDVLEMNNKEAARKDLHFDLMDHENVHAFADRTMITTVLQNLISNAINFTSPSGKISIKCRRNGDKAEVSVIDNGVGLSEEDIPRLFQFELLKTKIGSGDSKGAGLGLIICREMLHRNNGDISVVSEIGKGSEFVFTLPAVQLNVDQELDATNKNNSEAQHIMDDLLAEKNFPPAELISDILSSISPAFEEVVSVLSIENLDLFVKSVTETGEKHRIQLLINYGSAVNKLIRLHQIDQIIKLLPRFKDYLSILETKS